MALTETPKTELDLIQQAQAGDTWAFGELVRHHFSPVVNVAYRICGEMTLAEDMAQETFLRAWVNLNSFQPTGSLKNWLYRITVNATLDVLRRKSDMPMDDEVVQMIQDPTPDPETSLVQKERSENLQKLLRSLPLATRNVLVLREFGELSYQEIASVLDIPIGTVMSRLNYARTRLRDLLKEQPSMQEAYA
ncbi:MAG: sigma-70 family RNA polymerase sigma factor [Anaerolineaceae bacterium]|nr:MAG: sigma-70 family RNA polymerase sigma factor [Anaerolineaceae bacterium]